MNKLTNKMFSSKSGSWSITKVKEEQVPYDIGQYTPSSKGLLLDSAELGLLVCERDPVEVTMESENPVLETQGDDDTDYVY